MNRKAIYDINKSYWDAYADNWFGTTALPEYGVHFVTETELNLFGNVRGAKMLEICCGSGHSLKYHAERGAAELWGLDMSKSQLANAEQYLREQGHTAKLICSPMDEDCGIPAGYFDYVYSIYGMGWVMDTKGMFRRVAMYLKKGGTFIFSWQHPINHCVRMSEGGEWVFANNYFDESWFTMPVHGSEIMLCKRMISTYVNALCQAGFVIEFMSEQSNSEAMTARDDIPEKLQKAQLLPLSFVMKARKQ